MIPYRENAKTIDASWFNGIKTKIEELLVSIAGLNAHAAATEAHGVSGAVVGTTSTQTLTNKSMSAGCVWGGTQIAATRGGTGQSGVASGDILYASAANAISRLAKGTNGHVLTLVGGFPAWAAISGTAVPAGAFIPYGGTSAPTGYLLCDGSEISRATYADLFAALGTAHGSGDGSTTFRIPDSRGRFLRGVDHGIGHDPDRASRTAVNTGGNTGDAVGSYQGHAYMDHSHDSRINGAAVYQGASGGSGANNQNNTNGNSTGGQTWTTAGGSAGAGAETRPINIYANFIVKF